MVTMMACPVSRYVVDGDSMIRESMNADVSLAGRRLLSTILMVLFCVSCDSSSFLFCVSCDSSSSPEGPIEINFDFDSGLDGWTAGFAATVVLSMIMVAKGMMGLMPESR